MLTEEVFATMFGSASLACECLISAATAIADDALAAFDDDDDDDEDREEGGAIPFAAIAVGMGTLGEDGIS